jgi:very-short-patch-repair endonuclease
MNDPYPPTPQGGLMQNYKVWKMEEIEKSMYYAAKLVVEIDGEIHEGKKDYDDGRSAEMEKYLIRVIRFTNKEVENNIEQVINVIEDETRSRIQSPPWGI